MSSSFLEGTLNVTTVCSRPRFQLLAPGPNQGHVELSNVGLRCLYITFTNRHVHTLLYSPTALNCGPGGPSWTFLYRGGCGTTRVSQRNFSMYTCERLLRGLLYQERRMKFQTLFGKMRLLEHLVKHTCRLFHLFGLRIASQNRFLRCLSFKSASAGGSQIRVWIKWSVTFAGKCFSFKTAWFLCTKDFGEVPRESNTILLGVINCIFFLSFFVHLMYW